LRKTVIEKSIMAKIGIPHFWKSLRWTIMFKFLLAAVLTWFIGSQIGLMFEYNELCSNSPPEKIVAAVEKDLPQTAKFLENNNRDALKLQLGEIGESLKNRQRKTARYFYYNAEQPNFPPKTIAEILIFERNGISLESRSANFGKPDSETAGNLSGDEKLLLNKALQGEAQTVRLDEKRLNQIALPLKSERGETIGAIFIREQVPFSWWEAFAKSFHDFLSDLSEFWITLAICAFLFGFMQAHRITKRFEEIAVAAQSWSKGDFSARAPEKHADELGGLSKMLNQMAISLREVFRIKQDLAMSEERNRIARDLHDSVKQQVFGLGMQIGAAKAVLKTKPEAVENRLSEAENLVRQVQAELVNLIRELRPQDEENFPERLENYAQDWTRQNSIQTEISLDKNLELPQTIENTLFRIIQEALANAAKHSLANRVSIELQKTSAAYCLIIEDNGIGFNPNSEAKGIGLKTMRERAETLKNGSLKIESEKGVRIKVNFQV
jgi:two-component system, NarL family, sensor histidine kinase LiaS